MDAIKKYFSFKKPFEQIPVRTETVSFPLLQQLVSSQFYQVYWCKLANFYVFGALKGCETN